MARPASHLLGLGGLGGFGAGLVVASVASDYSTWWLVGSIVLATVQIGAVAAAGWTEPT